MAISTRTFNYRLDRKRKIKSDLLNLNTNFGEVLRTTGIGHFCFRIDSVDDAIAPISLDNTH